MPADQGLVDSVANSVKMTVDAMAAWSVAQVMAVQTFAASDFAAHQARMNLLSEKSLSKELKVMGANPKNELEQTLHSLKGVVTKIQGMVGGLQVQGTTTTRVTMGRKAKGKSRSYKSSK